MSPASSGMVAPSFHRPETGHVSTEMVRLASVAAEMLRIRQLRAEVFDANIFSEPGWNILLDLFVCWCRGTNCSVSDLCIASAAPATTALRWLTRLDGMGLIARTNDGEDRRRSIVILSPRGRQMMVDYLSRVEKGFR